MGDFRKSKLTEQEYQDAFKACDTKYTRAVTILTAELKKAS